ncbi:MAG TPA: PDZ domain-containing protein, partial [Pirellulales bacterium]|nr:PDZ domain-containing protein [Pirellulales bacterium]
MGTTLSRVSTFLPAVILFLGFSPALASAQDDDGNSSRDAQNARSDDDRPSNTDNSNDDSASRRRQGNAHHKALGVVLNEDGAGNLYIQRVVRGSPAERAGLRRGDEILTVEGQRVNHPDEMRRALARSDDDTVKVGILRRGRHQTVTASVGDADEVFGRSNAMNPARMYGPNSGQYRGYGRNDNQGYTSNVRQGYGRNDDQDDADPDLGMNGSNRGGRGYRGDDQGSQRQNLHRGAALGIALDQGPRRGAWVTDV